MAPKIINDEKKELEIILAKYVGRFEMLYDRWQDEKDYEDFDNYREHVISLVQNTPVTFLKMTKRPFRIYLGLGRTVAEVTVNSRQVKVEITTYK